MTKIKNGNEWAKLGSQWVVFLKVCLPWQESGPPSSQLYYLMSLPQAGHPCSNGGQPPMVSEWANAQPPVAHGWLATGGPPSSHLCT